MFEDQDIHFGFLAAVTGMAVGLVITDSGIAVPSTGAMVLLPYLLALSAEHAQETIADTKPRRGSTRTILMSAEDASEPQGAPKSGRWTSMRTSSLPVRMLLGLFVITLLILGLPQGAQAAPTRGMDGNSESEAEAASAGKGPIFIGVSGFSFEDLDPRTTPNLWRMMQTAQIGTITPAACGRPAARRRLARRGRGTAGRRRTPRGVPPAGRAPRRLGR